MTTFSLDGPWLLRLHGTPRGPVPHASLKRLTTGVPAIMPGTVHVALERAGVIADPYAARNELDVQWIDQQDWLLSTQLTVDRAACQAMRQELVFGGIDTIATIAINGRTVGHSVNMFRQVVCDVRRKLRPGRNTITVLLASPTRWAERTARASAGQVRSDDFVWQTGEKRASWRTAIRKVQCHFGWDWGTYLATSGLWMTSALECADTARIAAVQVAQQHHGLPGAPNRVSLSISVHVASPTAIAGNVVALLMGGAMPRDDRRGRAVISASKQVRTPAGAHRVELQLEVENPLLWWPAHEGPQYLYYLSVHIVDDTGARSPEVLTKIGLRTIAVVTEADTAADGTPAQSFAVVVNGRPIYAKGANWIPADQFVERCTPGLYRHLLGSLVEANQNMVRVWGGGWYEQDVFYDICDELGILVWQDFMMACGFYPDTPAFLDELAHEARYQIRRLSARPCIALWCGDNENNTGVAHWWKSVGTAQERMTRYHHVIDTLARVAQEEDPGRRFWPSSPSNGAISDDPDSPLRGDVHFWAVWHGKQPFSHYLSVKPRFVSEFGFQSFPEPRTLIPVIPPEELNPSSRVMEHHQRSNDGNLMITNTMAREMRIPKDFASFCWVSQINQAMAIRTAVEHWRRLKPWCMGTIYWQLNDLWPVASWSSIDYHGRWKVLHHAAGRFNAPVLASAVITDGQLEVWATSDLPRPLRLHGALTVVRWGGGTLRTIPLRVRLAASASQRVARIALPRLLGDAAESHQVCCFIQLAGDGVSAENFQTLVPWKWVALTAPRLTATLRLAASSTAGRQAGASHLELVVTPRTVVPFFHADLEGLEGHFAGDWQVLRPGRTYHLPWIPHHHLGAEPPTLSQARSRLTHFSLWDTYDHAVPAPSRSAP